MRRNKEQAIHRSDVPARRGSRSVVKSPDVSDDDGLDGDAPEALWKLLPDLRASDVDAQAAVADSDALDASQAAELPLCGGLDGPDVVLALRAFPETHGEDLLGLFRVFSNGPLPCGRV
ncbi:Hypothetical Protein RradSPS_3075 (plasmid) [Rubrobacter radiotolerans]|uniref:Uncharacterized protein n=1 Tax=Rubrobacter radiotolerans TaxID=42256 RepID=A0A023X7N9_RUBRA|nr:Hypothetical Protein RradSPS_3075 [Rubrobacter radiotolerans]